MKNDMKNRMITVVVGVMMVCLLPIAIFAQQGDWQSTSTMQKSGSVYSAQVTEVGATTVESQATTTQSYSPAQTPNRALRKESQSGRNAGEATERSNQSPIGDAIVPLLIMSFVFCGVIALRRKRNAINN